MPRGVIIRYNPDLSDFDEYFAPFDPEMNNPYVKHLLSLKVEYDYFYEESCLKHLRLLKSLDLYGIRLPDCWLNEIGMLVHLKLLIFWTETEVLPLSFSNLCNLETLVVNNLEGSCMMLSPWFWSLAKLRVVRMKCCDLSDPDINEPTVLDKESKLENLTTLSGLHHPGSEDMEDIFKRLPNLQTLEFRLKQLCFNVIWDSLGDYTHGLPSSLKKLKLIGLTLTSDSMSRIARLPNLQELTLVSPIIGEGEEWNMEDHVTFENLKSLKLNNVSFSEWQVDAEKSFPVLEELHIDSCERLMEIPECFGDIASLKFINVYSCPQLIDSTLKIEEYVEVMTGGKKLEVCFHRLMNTDDFDL